VFHFNARDSLCLCIECVPIVSHGFADNVLYTFQIIVSQFERLKSGEGFFTLHLSKEQKDAVVMFLGDTIDCCIQTLVGGAGCGKTAVIDEVLLQINRHHVEVVPGDAL
jgi:hypothetical protein